MKTARIFLLPALAIMLLMPSASFASVDEMVSDAVSKIQPTLSKISDDMKVVAVYSITGDKSGKVNLENLQDRIIGSLLKSEKFQVIDRANLKRLLEEQTLSMTGVVDEAQMVKAGKLIGVKGFFFGTVDVREESVVISLKLVSVETSAIVWSKDFVGEAASAAKLGIGWGIMSSSYGMDYEFKWINQIITGGPFTSLDSGKGLKNTGMTFIDGLVSYRQGIRGFNLGQVGCDLGFSVFSNEQTIVHSQKDTEDNLTALAVPTNMRWGGSINIDAFRIGLRPKLFLSMKNLLGWESDWLVPYVGASVDYYIMTLGLEVHRVDQAPPKQYQQMQEQKDTTLILISPIIGAEFSPARSISIFAEVIYQPGVEGKTVTSSPLNEIHIDVIPRIEPGVTFQAGVKYNFTLGGGSGK